MTTDKITTTEAEEAALANEAAIREQIADLRADLKQSQRSRRGVAEELSTDAAGATFQVLTDARELRDRRQAELEQAEQDLASMERRLEVGDDSVSVEDLLTAEKAVERVEKLLSAAAQDFRAAERKHQKADSDQHLALLAYDVLMEVTDAPVIIRKDAKQAPEVPEAVVLSQTKPTSEYGTLRANGEVGVSLIGNPQVNWKAVNAEFSRLGGDVSANASRIEFTEARWPTPRLTKPSAASVGMIGSRFCDLFAKAIELTWNPFNKVWQSTGEDAFTDVMGTSLDDQDGQVSGTVEVVVSGTGLAKDRATIESLANSLLRDLPNGDTPIGRVQSYELGEVHAEPEHEFTRPKGGLLLGPLLPWRVSIHVNAYYEEV